MGLGLAAGIAVAALACGTEPGGTKDGGDGGTPVGPGGAGGEGGEGGEGVTVRGLRCFAFSNESLWVRPCATRADCPMPGTLCPFELDPGHIDICWPSRCGSADPDIGSFPQNGNLFGSCDAAFHMTRHPTVVEGSCVPSLVTESLGTCFQIGTSTTTCRGRDPRGYVPSAQCAAGWVCDTDTSAWGESCTTDADCPQPWAICQDDFCRFKPCRSDDACGPDAYCASDLVCLPLGTCKEICNAGVGGVGVGAYAACSAGKSCLEHPENEISTATQIAYGLCVEP